MSSREVYAVMSVSFASNLFEKRCHNSHSQTPNYNNNNNSNNHFFHLSFWWSLRAPHQWSSWTLNSLHINYKTLHSHLRVGCLCTLGTIGRWVLLLLVILCLFLPNYPPPKFLARKSFDLNKDWSQNSSRAENDHSFREIDGFEAWVFCKIVNIEDLAFESDWAKVPKEHKRLKLDKGLKIKLAFY